jgi:hypothetical protein
MSVRGLFKSEIEKAQTRLNSLFGEETFLTFREDLRAIYIEHRDVEDATEWQKRAWMHMGRQGLDETRRRYISFGTHLDLLNLSDAALSAAIGFGINWGAKALGVPSVPSVIIAFFVSLFLYSMNTGLVFAKALVTEIAYPREQIHVRLEPADLRFRAGWNKGVIQSSGSVVGIIIYGTITHPGSRGYDLGLRLVKWWVKRG